MLIFIPTTEASTYSAYVDHASLKPLTHKKNPVGKMRKRKKSEPAYVI